jgi:hypothetical protein
MPEKRGPQNLLEEFIAQAEGLRQYVVPESIEVDGHTLFINSMGQILWSTDPNAWKKDNSKFVKGGSSDETPGMKVVRETIESTPAYKGFFPEKPVTPPSP